MIRYGHLIQAYQTSIWAMHEPVIESFGRGLAMAMQSSLQMTERNDGHWSVPVSQADGVAVVGIRGAIGKHLSEMELTCVGGCDLARVSDVLLSLDADHGVRSVVLDIRSPGGIVTGVPEFSKLVAGMSKPVYAYTDDMMASAAYWIGASTQGIFSSESAQVGSIGVYMALADFTEAYAKEGVKIHLIRAGKYKGMGLPGTLDAEAIELLQKKVDKTYDAFTSWVLSNRPGISFDDMQGQVFDADDALAKGLIDGIFNRVEDLVSQIAEAHNMETRR